MIRRTGNHRLRASLVAATLLLSACGGGDDSADDGSDASGNNDGGGAAALDDADDVIEEAEDAAEEILDSEGGTATVTIGDETWEFALYPQMPVATCDADFFGGFLALLTSEGELTDPLNQMNLTLPGGDFTEPPAITVKVNIGGEAEWIADETMYERSPNLPAGIGVTDFSIDGQSASGTALFYEEESFFQFNAGQTDELQMAEGSFQVTCAE